MIQNAPASCAHQVGIRMIRITSAFSAHAVGIRA
jgi:hypothetical protein